MAIHLLRPRHDLTLLSASELTRLLNIPESQMLKAIREGIIRPIGEIGRSAIIALTDDELDQLRGRFHPVSPENAPHRSLAWSCYRYDGIPTVTPHTTSAFSHRHCRAVIASSEHRPAPASAFS